jgi:glycosyltransferase involved in cell wall biosynthesis
MSSDLLPVLDLHVVTPCARIGNLLRISESIRAAQVPDSVRLHWLVVLDDRFDIDPAATRIGGAEVVICRDTTGVAGHAQRNYALEQIDGGWIVFVDDDNLLHPALPKTLAETIREAPWGRFVVVDQDLGDGIRRAGPENVRVGEIDSGQFAFERSFVGDARFDVYAYSADGIFAAKLFQRAPDRFIFVAETAAFYNALSPGRFGEPPPGRQTSGPLPRAHNAGSLHFHRGYATEGSIRLGSNVGGHRLYLSAPATMRSTLTPGRQRLSGRAWLDASSRGSAQLRIVMKSPDAADQLLVDSSLHFRQLLRLMGGHRFDVTFDAPPGAELEIDVMRVGTVVLDRLSITPS